MEQNAELHAAEANLKTATQNWLAMSPTLSEDMAHLALSSADTVLYQWDYKNGTITFSENINQLLPESVTLPHQIDEWNALIDPRDRTNWFNHSHAWQKDIGTYELRYRLNLQEDDVWVKHCASRPADSELLVGAITFNCTPPEQNASNIAVKRPALNGAVETDDSNTVNAGEFICRLQSFQENNSSPRDSSIVICAITSFNIIAQAFGQADAEKVMGELQEEIQGILPHDTVIYRIHNDQFGLILKDHSQAAAGKLCKRIEPVIRDYGNHCSLGAVHTSCNFGISSFRTDETNPALIVDRAFNDLNRHPDMLQKTLSMDSDDSMMARQQMGLANYLSKAIKEDRLRLAYQPIINSHTGETAHYEALLRLIDDKGHISSAGALIPIAEKMGLIDMLDRRVLEMVLEELKAYPNVVLAFNVSNMTTENPEWLSFMQEKLRDEPEIAARLIVEITETAAQRDLRRTAYFVAMVQDLGCMVALDDFGSGYTSFRQLKTLSVDMVKIDGDFIRDLTDNADNRFFVKTLLEFTELFGLKSVAEFVETGESAKLLMELGVDYMQGYYFAKPENQRSWLQDGEYKAS